MKLKVGVIQTTGTADRDYNVNRGIEKGEELARQGAEVLIYPEFWTCPYRTNYFTKFEEEHKGFTYKKLKALAEREKVFVVGGTIPTLDGVKRYNRCYVFNDKGEEIFTYDKRYLADMEAKKGVYIRESDNFSNGRSIGVFDIKGVTASVAVCYDLRFPELFQSIKDMGAKIIFMPVAFGKLTGEAHYHLLTRTRAHDLGGFIVSATQGCDEDLNRGCYGKSIVAGPYADAKIVLSGFEDARICEIDLDEIEEVHRSLGMDRARELARYNNKSKI